MTTTPRYQVALSLNTEDNKKKDELQKAGYSLIFIFRKGMEAIESLPPKK